MICRKIDLYLSVIESWNTCEYSKKVFGIHSPEKRERYKGN